jgi:PKD repeat protein
MTDISKLSIISIVIMFVSTLFMVVPNAVSLQTPDCGLSGYPTSTSEVQNIIDVMNANGLTLYRMSFNPEWFSEKPHPYTSSFIEYFLEHCTHTIIVDRNHLYPPNEPSADEARRNWSTVKASLLDVCQQFPNNPRVIVELINEYTSRDFQSRMQDLVNTIRDAGYTNPIVVDKCETRWSQSVLNDPENNYYLGMHFYFNSWSVSGATQQMQYALNLGLNVINTEIGADFGEYGNFDASEVDEVNQFLAWCYTYGIANCVWMNENLDNWPRYRELGVYFPTEPEPLPNEAPMAQANGPYEGDEETAITFTASGSVDPDGDPLTYRWDFGDGSTAETTSETITHTYTTGESGQIIEYSVSLVVNDGTVDSAPATTTATITGVNDLPLANANGPYTGVVGNSIVFDASSSADEEGISTYTWDLGDGTVTYGAIVTHHYAAAGTYTVQLKVIDTDGAEDTATTTAEITDVPAQPIAWTALTLSREDATRGRGTRVSRAQVTVSVTFDGSLLKGAIVYGQWSGAVDMIVMGTTNGEGTVTFRTDWVHNAGLFTFTITQIEQDGITYTVQGELSESI